MEKVNKRGKNESGAGLSQGASGSPREDNFTRIDPLCISSEHSFHRRAFCHDYFAPFIYHVILKKARHCEIFGSVIGEAKIEPGKEGCAQVRESELGRIVAKAIVHLPYEFPGIKLHQFIVMPDHVHMILQVLFRTDRDLDFYINFLMRGIAEKYSKVKGKEIPVDTIFQRGYCDKPLFDDRSLDVWYKYLKKNPHRLAVRLQHPLFFQRIKELNIDGVAYKAYGNPFLFRNPDKCAVKLSRKATLSEIAEKKAVWVSEASRGTVLVSPFIFKEEKSVREAAEAVGASIILLTYETFAERFKPAEHDFNLCTEGRLLIISLGFPYKTELTRAICQHMNALAEKIVKTTT